MRPILVDRLEDNEHKLVAKYSPKLVRRVITEGTAKLMVRAFERGAPAEGAAPAKAAVEPYAVAGMRGTGLNVDSSTNSSGKCVYYFLGFFPADKHEFCIYVGLNGGSELQNGRQAAAGIFRQIAERAASLMGNEHKEQGKK
jgi:stage V sporulation protein D (sporulation-specific penicillin-binding protein)